MTTRGVPAPPPASPGSRHQRLSAHSPAGFSTPVPAGRRPRFLSRPSRRCLYRAHGRSPAFSALLPAGLCVLSAGGRRPSFFVRSPAGFSGTPAGDRCPRFPSTPLAAPSPSPAVSARAPSPVFLRASGYRIQMRGHRIAIPGGARLPSPGGAPLPSPGGGRLSRPRGGRLPSDDPPACGADLHTGGSGGSEMTGSPGCASGDSPA